MMVNAIINGISSPDSRKSFSKSVLFGWKVLEKIVADSRISPKNYCIAFNESVAQTNDSVA
jgi:hypothetical protein